MAPVVLGAARSTNNMRSLVERVFDLFLPCFNWTINICLRVLNNMSLLSIDHNRPILRTPTEAEGQKLGDMRDRR